MEDGYIDIAREQLAQHENCSSKAYRDSKGHWTIGIGHKLDRWRGPISQRKIDRLFREDIRQAEEDARKYYPTFDLLSADRQAILINMSFQLGLTRLLGFTDLRSALRKKQYERAAEEMLDSKWAKQDSPARARELACIMMQRKSK